MLDVTDKPGKISKAEMRAYFENGVTNTPALKANTPLGIVTINGEFSHYADTVTDTMWLGFALGMRCAERVQAAKDKTLNEQNSRRGEAVARGMTGSTTREPIE